MASTANGPCRRTSSGGRWVVVGPDDRGAPPRRHGGGRRVRRRRRRGQQDEAGPTHAEPAEAFEDSCGPGPPVQPDDHRATVSPHLRSRGHRPPREGYLAGEEQPGRDQDGEDHDDGRSAEGRSAVNGQGGGGQHGEVRGPELAQGCGGSPASDEVEPAKGHAGREVQRGGEERHVPGDRPRQEAPDHDEAGGRAGQQVGGDGDERHPAEHRRQQGGHGDLSGQGHGCRLAHRGRAGEPRFEAGGQDHDPGRGRHGEAEPDRVDQDRVHQQQGGDGEGQHPGTAHGPPSERGPRGNGRHGRGAQDGGLEAGQEGEEGEDQQHGQEPAPQPESTQPHAGHHQHEGHVLPGHGQEMAQPRGSEVVGRRRRLCPVVAEEDPGEQGGGILPQGLRTPDHRSAQMVGDRAHRVRRTDRADDVDDEAAGHVTHGQVGSAGDRHDASRQDRTLSRQCLDEARGVRPVVGLGLQATTVEADHRGHLPAVDLGVGDQGDGPSGDRCRWRRLEAGPGGVGQSGRQQQAANGEQRRSPGDEGRRHRHHTDGAGHGGRPPRADGHRQGHHDRRPIAHRSASPPADARWLRTASVR